MQHRRYKDHITPLAVRYLAVYAPHFEIVYFLATWVPVCLSEETVTEIHHISGVPDCVATALNIKILEANPLKSLTSSWGQSAENLTPCAP